MTVKKLRLEEYGTFFITFTCVRWIPLFEITDIYDCVYRQFEILKGEGHFIHGYVIMPNHIHFILSYRKCEIQINKRIGTIKRFLAYEIIKRLKKLDEKKLLSKMQSFVGSSALRNGKIHTVFEPSFDIKNCYSFRMIQGKLNYIHRNPCKAKVPLVKNPWDFKQSSAKYYFLEGEIPFPVTHFKELEVIDLSKA